MRSWATLYTSAIYKPITAQFHSLPPESAGSANDHVIELVQATQPARAGGRGCVSAGLPAAGGGHERRKRRRPNSRRSPPPSEAQVAGSGAKSEVMAAPAL